MDIEDKGFILKKTEYGDYDIFGTFYTSSLGKINLLIKNARKSKKRFVGKLELFNLVSIKLKYRQQDSNPSLLQTIDLVGSQDYIGLDKRIMVLSSLVNEYVENFEIQENPSRKKFNYLENFFLRNDKNNLSLCLNEVIKFQLKYLKDLGIAPNIKKCFKCQKELKEINFFDIKNGGNICYNCHKQDVDIDSRKISKKINLRNITRDNDAKLNLIKIIIAFSEFHSGKRFNSVQYLD
jgi:DNA repair protein RecO (recombination protein O)|tara:strand:- start:1143 stop:1853 length:711 start_codon:yes stop_codon:yes gene_type:complete